MRLRAACFERVPQFLQRAELTGGVCEISALFRGRHRAAQRDGVGDAVLQLRHYSQVSIGRLLAAEGESAFGVVVVGHGIAVHRYGFGFCEHKLLAAVAGLDTRCVTYWLFCDPPLSGRVSIHAAPP
jgi:hypothetical protein